MTDDIDALRLDKVRLVNLLSDIVNEATNHPARLVAFNSPILQLAVLEIWGHNNPGEDYQNDVAASRAKLLATIADRNRT